MTYLVKLKCIALTKNKISTLTPEKNGSKLLSFIINAENEDTLQEKIRHLIYCLNCINQNSAFRTSWLQYAFTTSKLQISDNFKTKLFEDNKFWNVLKSQIVVENNVSLSSFMAFVSINQVVKRAILVDRNIAPTDWPYDVKNLAFTGGVIPLYF